MIIINQKEIDNVVALEASKRYKYFINRVCDTEKVWGLFDDGWALAADDLGQKVLPIWPMKEFAILCAQGDWISYNPKSIDIHDFIDSYIFDLEKENIVLGVFYTPKNNGIVVDNKRFLNDIRLELGRIE